MIEADGIEQFKHTMRAAGLEPPQVIKPGKLHRFSTNGKASDDAGWCELFTDLLGGVYGDHHSGLSETWQAKREQPFTEVERQAFKVRFEQEKQERQAEQARQYAEAAAKATTMLEAATGDPSTHPYALKRKVSLGKPIKRGAWPQRGWAGALLIPIYAADEKHWRTIEWYPSIDGAVNGLGCKVLRTSQVASLAVALAAIDRIVCTLRDVLEPHFHVEQRSSETSKPG